MTRFASSLGGDHQQHVDLMVVFGMILGGLVVLGLMAAIATSVLGAP
ncbi:hypothetical protein [Oryzihumus sp.]